MNKGRPQTDASSGFDRDGTRTFRGVLSEDGFDRSGTMVGTGFVEDVDDNDAVTSDGPHQTRPVRDDVRGPLPTTSDTGPVVAVGARARRETPLLGAAAATQTQSRSPRDVSALLERMRAGALHDPTINKHEFDAQVDANRPAPVPQSALESRTTEANATGNLSAPGDLPRDAGTGGGGAGRYSSVRSTGEAREGSASHDVLRDGGTGGGGTGRYSSVRRTGPASDIPPHSEPRAPVRSPVATAPSLRVPTATTSPSRGPRTGGHAVAGQPQRLGAVRVVAGERAKAAPPVPEAPVGTNSPPVAASDRPAPPARQRQPLRTPHGQQALARIATQQAAHDDDRREPSETPVSTSLPMPPRDDDAPPAGARPLRGIDAILKTYLRER